MLGTVNAQKTGVVSNIVDIDVGAALWAFWLDTVIVRVVGQSGEAISTYLPSSSAYGRESSQWKGYPQRGRKRISTRSR